MRLLIVIAFTLISLLGNAQQNKRHSFLGWYSYLNGSKARLLPWEPLNDIYLFPDSTVKATVYTDTTSEFTYVNLHTVGQTFTSNSFLYVDPLPLPYFCRYTIDTIGFYYRYNHVIKNSVDTLRVKIFQNEQITRNTSGPFWYASIPYDTISKETPNSKAEYVIDILLDESYHTGLNIQDTQFLSITIPDDGLKIKQKNGAAFTVTFLPGYNYALGDTLQANYISTPQKKLNGFLPVLYRDTTKYVDTTANNGLFVFTPQRYNLPHAAFDTLILPGKVFNETNWALDAKFHVTGNICGETNVTDISNNLLKVNLYPNPAESNFSILLELNQPEKVSITITDMMGKVVRNWQKEHSFSSGSHNLSYDVSTLANGVYYVSVITSNGYSSSLPLVVNH